MPLSWPLGQLPLERQVIPAGLQDYAQALQGDDVRVCIGFYTLDQFPPGRQIVPAPFEGDVKALQLIINVDKEAKNPDSEDGLCAIESIGAIESIAKKFIFHARNSSRFLSQINDRDFVEFSELLW